MSDTSLWDSCLDFFEKSLPPQQFNSWIRPLVCTVNGEQITLTAPNSFTLKVIQERFLPDIQKQAQSLSIKTPVFEFKIGKKSVPPAVPKNVVAPEPEPVASKTLQRSHGKLNNLLAFDTFVTGKANQLAHAAAMQVANFPGTTYNPLFI